MKKNQKRGGENILDEKLFDGCTTLLKAKHVCCDYMKVSRVVLQRKAEFFS